MKKIGLSIGAYQNKFGDLDALEIAKKIGCDTVDFDLCGGRWDYKNPSSVYAKSDEEIVEYFTKVKEKAAEVGIEISQTHGRISGLMPNEEENVDLFENMRRDCLATKTMGAPICVVHSATTCRFGPDADPEFMHNNNERMFREYLGFAKQYGIKLATETFGDAPNFGCCDFFGNNFEFLRSFHRLSAIDDFKDYLEICMDTGHCNKALRFNNNPTPANFIRTCGRHITCLHLNDNNTLTDQHKMPFSGSIDWEDVFNALDEVGYNGAYNMELALGFYGKEVMVETGEFAVKVLRNYLNKRYGE